MWKSCDSGDFFLKYTFYSVRTRTLEVLWDKAIWLRGIAPYKSFLLWRIIHNRMSTDEYLWSRGCIVVFMWSLCKASVETTHLFFDCCFAQSFWSWFEGIIQQSIDISSML